jgi:hypothetical protein
MTCLFVDGCRLLSIQSRKVYCHCQRTAEINQRKYQMIKRENIEILKGFMVLISVGIFAGCASDADRATVEMTQQNISSNLSADVLEAQHATRINNEALAECIAEAPDPETLEVCKEDYVQSLASILNVSLPPKTSIGSIIDCAESSAHCILGLTSRTSLIGCASNLANCAIKSTVGVVGDVANAAGDLVGEVVDVTGDVVNVAVDVTGSVVGLAGDLVGGVVGVVGVTTDLAGDLVGVAGDLVGIVVRRAGDTIKGVITDVRECTTDYAWCARLASKPSELTACTRTQVECVADTLGVRLPQIPLSEATACTENAIDCTLTARRLRDVDECAIDLVDCANNVVTQTPSVKCGTLYTKCLLANPFAFSYCAQKVKNCSP